MLLRINEEPISIDNDYKNKVVKENSEFYIINVRDKSNIEFSFKLTQTPFDRFEIPFKVELTSRELKNKDERGKLYRFNCHQNVLLNDNMSFKKDTNKLPDF